MIIIGLTGPSGSGKTMLCDIARRLGIESIDADKVYHDLLVPPSPCLDEIIYNFGSDMLNDDNTLNRRALGGVVFKDEKKLILLNSITHKYVKEEFRNILSRYEALGTKCVIVDAPTLFESGFDKECSFTVALLADKASRAQRIIGRDGLSSDVAEQRLAAQKSDEFFIEHSDYIIYNNGDPDELKDAFCRILKERGGLDEN